MFFQVTVLPTVTVTDEGVNAILDMFTVLAADDWQAAGSTVNASMKRTTDDRRTKNAKAFFILYPFSGTLISNIFDYPN